MSGASGPQPDGHETTQTGARLDVVPSLVVESGDGWAADGGVVPVMVVAVQEPVKSSRSAGSLIARGGRRPIPRRGCV